MKTWIPCTLLAAMAVCLPPCAAAETIREQPKAGDIEAFLTSRDPDKVKQLKGEYDEVGVCLYVIKAVGELKDKAGLPFLLKALNGPQPQSRLWAALALKDLGAKAAIGPLMARLDDAEQVRCYGFCRSQKMANARLGVCVRAAVADAVIEALNGLIPGRKAEDKFSDIFYPSEEKKKSPVFQFFGQNLPERPDTGHWGRPPERKTAAEELRAWWQKHKDDPTFGG